MLKMFGKMISRQAVCSVIARLGFLLIAHFTATTHAKELLVGVEDIEYYPIYAKRDGQYAGFARDFLDAFAEQYGHTMTYKPMPIKRLYGEFLNGRVDLKFPDNENWAREKKTDRGVVYSTGVLEYIDGVMVPPSNLSKGPTALKTLGTVRGFTPWDYLDQINAGKLKLKENSDLKGLLELVKAERINGVYFNVLVARHWLKHTLFDENAIVFDSTLPHSRNKYHVSSIKHADIIEQISEFVAQQPRVVNALKEKYEIRL